MGASVAARWRPVLCGPMCRLRDKRLDSERGKKLKT
jgi:hypothetical protein